MPQRRFHTGPSMTLTYGRWCTTESCPSCTTLWTSAVESQLRLSCTSATSSLPSSGTRCTAVLLGSLDVLTLCSGCSNPMFWVGFVVCLPSKYVCLKPAKGKNEPCLFTYVLGRLCLLHLRYVCLKSQMGFATYMLTCLEIGTLSLPSLWVIMISCEARFPCLPYES